jgi:hypothetical protein
MAIYRFVEHREGKRRIGEWRWRALRVIGLLGAIIAVCTAGLALLDDSRQPIWHKLLSGLWNAVNLVTTLGDFSDFDERQKMFMLTAMLGVMFTGAYAISTLTGILSSPEVVAYRENHQLERTLKNLSGHAVVLGFVGTSRLLANELRSAGHEVVIIERESPRATLASEEGYLVIQGDAEQSDGVLAGARIDSARTLFVATDDDNRNLALTLMARSLQPALRIVVTATGQRWGEMLSRAGASEVVIADRLLAQAMLTHHLNGRGAKV